MNIREIINRLKEAKAWALNNQILGMVDEKNLQNFFLMF